MPNTPIIGDPRYRLINGTTLEIQHGDGWWRYTKCTTDTNPRLDYSSMQTESPGSAGSSPGHVVYFQPNVGIPDYAHKSPFGAGGALIESLTKALAAAVMSPKPCKVGEVDVPDLYKTPLFTNICDKAQSDALRRLIAELAPDLTFATTTVWKAAIGSGSEAFLITHVDVSADQYFHYPYLSLWRLDLRDGRVDAQFGGSFLAGEIHAIRPFGHDDKVNKLFVKYLSCLECEPWVYLTVVDFSGQTGKPIRFTYADNHKDFDDTIEYQLPGMGHSIDATVETRIPKVGAGRSGDLIQAFRYTDEKKVEWWVFSCEEGRCDYQMFIDSLPQEYRLAWASADKL
jgi:hypothetical protein